MRTAIMSAVVLLAAACGIEGQVIGQLGETEQAVACQGTLAECIDSCKPTTAPVDCVKKQDECQKLHPDDMQGCREEKAACEDEQHERRTVLRACLKLCRDDFRNCTPSIEKTGARDIATCINSSNLCIDSCEDQADKCIATVTNLVHDWVLSIEKLFSFCVAQAGDNYQELLKCLGGFPQVNLDCIEATGTCYENCSKTLETCLSQLSTNTLLPNKYLYKNEYLQSNNGSYRFYLQGDGNLVLRAWPGSKVLWASGTNGSGGSKLILQESDGNLVLYTSGNKPVWASKTVGKGAKRLTISDNGNLALYNSSGGAVWSKP